MGQLQHTNNIVGYLKYEGTAVQEGIMGAQEIVSSLSGFHNAIKFYLKKEDPRYENLNFDLPVKVQQGCLEFIVPLIKWGAVIYAAGVITQIAQNDFKNITSKDIFLHSLKCIKNVIKIAKHLGSFGNTTFKTKSSFGDPFITIYNDAGKEIVVHRDMIDIYLQTPPGLLGKMANTISAERELEVGYIDENQELQKENISLSEKYIFASTEEEDDILPELVHAKNVELIGEITRGNSSTNRLGIKYKEKILTCIPEKGDIRQYKNCIFRKCRIYGIVSREDEFGNITEKKPKIIFYKLIPIDEVPSTPNLFNIQ